MKKNVNMIDGHDQRSSLAQSVYMPMTNLDYLVKKIYLFPNALLIV